MAYSLYDAAVTPCAQQLGALAGIIDKAAAHCATNKIEELVLLQDRLYPDMFCLARQIRQSADFAMNAGGRLAGVTPPALPAVDDTSFAAAKSRVETALAFVKSLTLRTGRRRGGQSYHLDRRRQRPENEGQRLSATVRPAEFLLLCNDGVQYPASSRRAARKAGLPRPGQLALGASKFCASQRRLLPNSNSAHETPAGDVLWVGRARRTGKSTPAYSWAFPPSLSPASAGLFFVSGRRRCQGHVRFRCSDWVPFAGAPHFSPPSVKFGPLRRALFVSARISLRIDGWVGNRRPRKSEVWDKAPVGRSVLTASRAVIAT